MRKLVVFLALSIVTAVLAVATPILAGRVVDAKTSEPMTGVLYGTPGYDDGVSLGGRDG